MTISLTARSADGALGMVIASSSPAVAARCMHLRPGIGAAASQNVTNPALGGAVLDRLAAGETPAEALDAALAGDAYPAYRQLTAVDMTGRVAVRSGAQALGIHGEAVGASCVAAGNLLANDGVLGAMVAGFEGAGTVFEAASAAFEERLLAGLRAGLDAGGEAGPLRSAGLAVVEDAAWRTTDLRVDDHDDPVAELARLLALWLPQKADYLTRALDPTAAPSYGVPGDE